jgi:threonine aldolase
MGVDILVIGGTKAGMTATEAVVILDKIRARRFDARLKQAGQLPSKARFLAAPFIGMLEDGAMVRHAAHANAMAARLAAACPFPAQHAVETNGVFVRMDEPTLERLHATGWFAYRFTDGTVRFMCSWATTAEAVDELANVLQGLA